MKQNETLKTRAKFLRKNATQAEHKLWYYLRARRFNRYKFRRQHIIGQYIVDFVCERKKIIIELDGGQHALRVDYDVKRTIFLESQGYKVIRFWNNQVSGEIEDVLNHIFWELERALPLPLPE